MQLSTSQTTMKYDESLDDGGEDDFDIARGKERNETVPKMCEHAVAGNGKKEKEALSYSPFACLTRQVSSLWRRRRRRYKLGWISVDDVDGDNGVYDDDY